MHDNNDKNIDINKYVKLKRELTRFMMNYRFGLAEINTKIDILKQEFQYIHEYNPIEHVKSRLKSPDSILKKAKRKNYPLNINGIQSNIRDIAGVRITCSFLSDIYKVSEMLSKQKDVTIIETKDYIKHPKSNGYMSLHHIVQVPVFMSDRIENVYVEVQIRTIAMDFWASLEHKIFYKYNKEIPLHLTKELKAAAVAVAELDKKMEDIHIEVGALKELFDDNDENIRHMFINDEKFDIPMVLMDSLLGEKPIK